MDIANYQWDQLKFIDEASFLTRRLNGARRGYAARGRRPLAAAAARWANGHRRLTVLGMTSLNNTNGILWTVKEGSFQALHFAEFLLDQLSSNDLIEGDVIVLDNATIHLAGANMIGDILNQLNIRILFLPPYSPELNPIELVWAMLKRHIRSHHRNREGESLPDAIADAIATLNRSHVFAMYNHVLNT